MTLRLIREVIFSDKHFDGADRRFSNDGTLVTAAQLGPGVNPITFSDDDRLFVSQCFFGTGSSRSILRALRQHDPSR